MAKKSTVSISEKFADARRALCECLIERNTEVNMVLAGLISRENVLFVGPPGTAKSLLCDLLLQWITKATKFDYLFHKFTAPEEVFGPFSIPRLKNDEFIRITKGRLPEAHIAFFDEFFNASPAIRNMLLKIANERTFDAGDGIKKKVPLAQMIAASNLYPDEQESPAIFDRFLLRRTIRPISSHVGKKRLMKMGWTGMFPEPKYKYSITPEELAEAHKEAMALPPTNEANECFERILHGLSEEGIFPGDRRVLKSIGAVKAMAYLHEAEEVLPEHCTILAHTLWMDPAEQPAKAARIVGKFANPTGTLIEEKRTLIEQLFVGNPSRDLVPKLQDLQKEVKAYPAHPEKQGLLDEIEDALKQAFKLAIGADRWASLEDVVKAQGTSMKEFVGKVRGGT